MDTTILGSAAALGDCSTDEHEYWLHVSSQEELPLAPGTRFSADQIGLLNPLADEVAAYASEPELVAFLATRLLADPSLVEQLRTLVSVSDKRLYLDLSYLFSRVPHPSNPERTLCGCPPHLLNKHSTAFFERILGRVRQDEPGAALAANLISRYFVEDKNLLEIIRLYGDLDEGQREVLAATLILPGEVQQNEAKRRGHGAEGRLAQLLETLGASILPVDKADNPMGAHDPNVDADTFRVVPRDPASTFSFDLLVSDARGRIRVCVQALVQSSDPGQFGVDKSNQTVLVRDRIERFNDGKPDEDQVRLWGLLDGVGYSENKEGTINKMLRSVHSFVQVKSLYKAALELQRLNLINLQAIQLDYSFYSPTTARQMIERYVPPDIRVLEASNQPNEGWRPVGAGRAVVYT